MVGGVQIVLSAELPAGPTWCYSLVSNVAEGWTKVRARSVVNKVGENQAIQD